MSQNYIEELHALNHIEKESKFIDLCNTAEEVQKNVLFDIISKNAKCKFSKKYKITSIESIDDFRKKLPIMHWKDFEDMSKKMEHGIKNQLFEDIPENFIITSGSTGANKLIPQSKMGNMAKIVTGELRNSHLMHSYPKILKGKFLPLSNPTEVGYTPAGIPISSASGFTTKNTASDILKLNACPQPAKEAEDLKAVDYAIMRFGIAEDVRVITGNNAGRIPILLKIAQKNRKIIIEDIKNGTLSEEFDFSQEIRKKLIPYLTPNPKRAAELEKLLKSGKSFLPQSYWPNLKVIRCWLSGSVGRYLEELKEMLKNHPNNPVYIDGGYGASEGKFNIPLKDGISSGPLTIYSAFYEFIPIENNNNDTLLAHQLEDKKEYKMIITTYSGLYRYDMKDIITVDGFTGTTPNIKFASKTADIGNICGEKLSVSVLIETLNFAKKGLNLDIKHFAVVPDKKMKKYIFCIETEKNYKISDTLKKELSHKIDSFLRDNVIIYMTFREQYLLDLPEVKEMKKGWQKDLYAKKIESGLSISQIKLPIIYDSVPCD
jgi:hypothetical protein